MNEYYKKTDGQCKLCGNHVEPVISLPALPPTDIMFDRPTYIPSIDQDLCLCHTCGHVQLSSFIIPEALYSKNYYLRTSQGIGSQKTNFEFLNFIDMVSGDQKFKNIIEVGCNDCYLLEQMRDRAENLI